MSDGASSEIPEDGPGNGAVPENQARAETAAEPTRENVRSADPDGKDAGVNPEPEGDAAARTVQIEAGVARAAESAVPAAHEAEPQADDDADANAETTVIPVLKPTPLRPMTARPSAPLYNRVPDHFGDASAETVAVNAAPFTADPFGAERLNVDPFSAAPSKRASVYSAPPPAPPLPPEPDSAPAAASSSASELLARIPRRSIIIAGGLVTVGAAGGIAAAVASSGGSGSKQLPGAAGGAPNGSAATSAAASPSPTFPPVSFTTVPANGAANVDPSQPITVTVANGTISSVELSGGQTTSGTLSDDKSTWTSNGTLAPNTSYTLQIQAAGKDGKTVGSTASFSTLKPTATLGVLEMWPGDGISVGVGQPIRVQFTNYVPKEYRAAVEKACAVTTSPAVAGAWYWVQEDMMDWRPQNYWQAGTQVSVALNLAGVKAGTHQYGAKNHTLNFNIRGTDLRLIIDTKAFRATCYQNGQVIRTFPIDTGMNDPRFITWSGTLAVLGKGNPVEMKGDYGNGDKYDELVTWATQITYSGTYVHAAPWDGEIGRVNSSHGCIHASTTDATWFYNLAHVGDVVQVTGTGKNVSLTNGFGDFGISWSSWLAGSSYGATIGGKPTNA